MCNFFSCLSDGQGNIYYFTPRQRKGKVIMPGGTKIKNYDSHTDIAAFYGFTDARKDQVNWWRYNPFAEELALNRETTFDDRESVLEKLNAINWHELCGDMESVRNLLAQAKTIPWFDSNGELPKEVKLFETREAAQDAAYAVAQDSDNDYISAWADAWGDAMWAARGDIREAAQDYIRSAAWDIVWKAGIDATLYLDFDVAGGIARDAAWDAALLAGLHVCAGLDIDPKHIQHAKLRWSVWEAGYCVALDVDGVIYAYRRVI